MEKRGQATFFIKKLPVPIRLYLTSKLVYKSLMFEMEKGKSILKIEIVPK